VNHIFEGYFNLEPLELFQRTSNDFKSNFLSHYEVKMTIELQNQGRAAEGTVPAWIDVCEKE